MWIIYRRTRRTRSDENRPHTRQTQYTTRGETDLCTCMCHRGETTRRGLQKEDALQHTPHPTHSNLSTAYTWHTHSNLTNSQSLLTECALLFSGIKIWYMTILMLGEHSREIEQAGNCWCSTVLMQKRLISIWAKWRCVG